MYKKLFILVIFFIISGCEGSIKEEDLTKTEEGEIDPRYYKGMYIYGNLKTNLDNSSGGFSHQGKLPWHIGLVKGMLQKMVFGHH